jgi:hypothetical protein
MMKALERIKVLEDELALLKADLTKKEAQPITISESFSFEIYPTDLGEMKWDEAKKTCADLGDGWRLPTIEECFIMYRNKAINKAYCWSSTEYVYNSAWYFSFNDGAAYYYGNKNSTYYVRAVRDIKKL